jgi:hypothetical protein
MSEVKDNSFVTDLTDSTILSPQLQLVPEIEAEPAEASKVPYQEISIESFTDFRHPVNEEVSYQIVENKKWLYGYSTAGADVPATQESRLKGIRNIISSFELYKNFKETTPTELVKNARIMESTRNITGNKVTLHEMFQGKEDSVLEGVFWELVGKHDPLIVTLAQIDKSGDMPKGIFNSLVKDSIAAFHRNEIKLAVNKQVAVYRKALGKTAIA